MSDWNSYFKKHLNRKPRKQLVKAINFCINKNEALDLGSGTFIESKYILENGFKKVIAVDNAPETKIFYKKNKDKRLFFEFVSFKDFKFKKNNFDLINAQFSLPFFGKNNFTKFFKNIKNSLKEEGIFAGQFFGINHEWNTKNSELVFHTKKEIHKFFSDLEIIEFLEEDKEDKTASGKTIHWHIFYVIARKK